MQTLSNTRMGDKHVWLRAGLVLGATALLTFAFAAPYGVEASGGGDILLPDGIFDPPPAVLDDVDSSWSSVSDQGSEVLWTKYDDVDLCGPGAWYACAIRLVQPQATIRYAVQAKNIDTDTVYPYGSAISINEGESIQLRFVPHAPSDINWFGTGSTFDTPYGEWVDGATADSVQCNTKDFVQQHYQDPYTYNVFARLLVDPPTKTFTPADNLSCTDTGDGLTYNCIANSQGTSTATFDFGQTNGNFFASYQYLSSDTGSIPEWARGGVCAGQVDAMQNNNGFYNPVNVSFYSFNGEKIVHPNDPRTPYTLTIPAQSRQYTIVVGEAEEDDSPGSPSVNPVTVNGDPTACTTNAPYTVEVTATDPQSDDIRYLIDWDADDTVNAYAPSSGYTTSGTTQTASRTFTTEGERSVKVRAQDEHGNLSDWSETFTFTCTDDTPPYTPTVTTASGSQCTPDTAQDVTVSADHASDKEVYYQLDWDRDGATDTRLPATGTVAAGTELTTTHTFTSGDYAFRARAVDEDDIASNWTTITGTCGVTQEECPICAAGSPDVSLSAQPSLVAQDASTTLSWDIAGIDTLQTCSITGTNGDSVSWDTISSQSSYTTPSITIQTTYTLSCTYTDQTLTDTALIFLVPDWQEF